MSNEKKHSGPSADGPEIQECDAQNIDRCPECHDGPGGQVGPGGPGGHGGPGGPGGYGGPRGHEAPGGFQGKIKKIKWNQLIIALVLLAFGLLLMLLPSTATGILCTVISIMMAVGGAVLILTFFLNKNSLEKLNLALGITIFLFGIACLTRPGLLEGMLSIVFGIFVILDGSSSVAEGMTCKRANISGWIPLLVFGFISIVLGAIVLFGSFDTVMFFVGLSLIVDSVLDILALIFFSRKIKEAKAILAQMNIIKNM